MKKYTLLISVKNIWIQLGERSKLMGFFQTFFLEAEDPDQAAEKAFELLLSDPSLNEIWDKTRQSKEPEIYISEMYEMEAFDPDLKGDRTGRSIFLMKKWWEFWK